MGLCSVYVSRPAFFGSSLQSGMDLVGGWGLPCPLKALRGSTVARNVGGVKSFTAPK